LAVPETPSFVQKKLEEMERALLLLLRRPQDRQQMAMDGGGTDTGEAYREAQLLGSRYIHDPNLRLMFLRAELFDASRAALRLVKFLQILRDYLGPEALVNKPWTLKMFGPDDLRALKSGVYQIFPGRDQAGRRVHSIMDDSGDLPILTIVSQETSRCTFLVQIPRGMPWIWRKPMTCKCGMAGLCLTLFPAPPFFHPLSSPLLSSPLLSTAWVSPL
jgi:hypothetical protein